MRRHRFQFRLSTLLWIMLALGCFCAGLLWDHKQVAQLTSGLDLAWRIIHDQDEELMDLHFGKKQADEMRDEFETYRQEHEPAMLRQEIEKARTWWGSVTILAIWFLVIGIGCLIVIRRQARQSATTP